MSNELSAAIFLSALAAALAIRVAVALIRSPYTPLQSVAFFGNVLLTRLLWRAKVPDRLPLPDNQGAVIVCNHRSSVDPFFVQLAVGGVAHWMVDREPFQHWFTGRFLRLCQAIPVGRGGIDTAATKTAIRLASQGELVGMFPEGRINETEKFMLSLRPGAALIALKARVPILPCYIHGAPYAGGLFSPFTMRAKVEVRFGSSLDLTEFYDRERDGSVLREVMRRWAGEMARLANQPAFEPEFAGRAWKDEE